MKTSLKKERILIERVISLLMLRKSFRDLAAFNSKDQGKIGGVIAAHLARFFR